MRERIKKGLEDIWNQIADDALVGNGGEMSSDEVRDLASDQFAGNGRDEEARTAWMKMSDKERCEILKEVFSYEYYSW